MINIRNHDKYLGKQFLLGNRYDKWSSHVSVKEAVSVEWGEA